jgi:hypothetical protein
VKSGSAGLVKVTSYQPPVGAVWKLKLAGLVLLTVAVTLRPYASSIVTCVCA